MHNGQPLRLDDGGPFSFREGVLYDGGVAVDELAAAAGTPRLPVCTRRCGGRVRRLRSAFRPGRVLYSVKANGNLALLRRLAAIGAGFDVVSGGELLRVLRAGGRPDQTVFAGVGKTAQELAVAVRSGVVLHVESADELAACRRWRPGWGRGSVRVAGQPGRGSRTPSLSSHRPRPGQVRPAGRRRGRAVSAGRGRRLPQPRPGRGPCPRWFPARRPGRPGHRGQGRARRARSGPAVRAPPPPGWTSAAASRSTTTAGRCRPRKSSPTPSRRWSPALAASSRSSPAVPWSPRSWQ